MKNEDGPEEAEARKNAVPAKYPHPRRRPNNKTAGHRVNRTQEHKTGSGVTTDFVVKLRETQRHLLKLPEYFKDVWEGLNLGPGPTFNMLRSSVATFAKRQLGRKKKYERVATFMCHDPQTAKRFYQADDPTEDTAQSRLLMMMAVFSYAIRKKKKKKGRSKRAGVDCDEVATRAPQLQERVFAQLAVSKE
ncbi:hypothetical protein PAMP_020644 [Pampus punctatissimus]